jgi:addiction module RelE/StbE family toxin
LKFEVRFLNAVRRDLRRLDKTVQQVIQDKHLPQILRNPHQASTLRQDLKGLKSYHFSYQGVQYRIVYEVYQDNALVIILFIGSRENLYDQVKQRLQR